MQQPTASVEPSNAPSWPFPGSDADINAQDSSEETTTENQFDGTGWSGGSNYTPEGGNPPVTEGRVPPSDSNMPLAEKKMFLDDGSTILAANNPPGYPQLDDPYADEDGNVSAEDRKTKVADTPNMVGEWIVREGQTLREVLEEWSAREGWTVVWNTHREYPLKASAVFTGRYSDVSSGLIRTFVRATPPPYGKFYFGNKVLVVKTLEDENAD